jgi:hypothetical protein
MLYTKAARTVLKGLTIGLSLLLLLLIAGSVWLGRTVRRQVVPALQRAVYDLTGGLYTAQVGTVSVYPLGRRLVLEDLVLALDSLKLEALRRQDSLPDKLLRLRIPKLEVDGILWEHLLQGKNAVLGAVTLTDPLVEMQLGAGSAPFELHLPKTRQLASLQIKRLRATGLRTRVHEWAGGQAYLSVRSTGGALTATNLQTQKGAPVSFETLLLSAGTTSVHLPFVAHQISAAGWQFDGKTRIFYMQGFRFVQQPVPGSGARTLHEVYIPGLQVQGFRTVEDSTRPLYEIARVGLLEPQIHARLKRRITDKYDSSERYFPQLLLQRAGVPLRIKQVTMQGGSVAFTQSHPRTGLEGSISFEDLHGVLGPLLLQPPREKALRDPLLLHLEGRFQHRSGVLLQGKLSNLDPQQAFELRGKLQQLEVGEIREVARSLGQIQLGSGIIDSLTFTIRGNSAAMQTQLTLAYSGLKLTPLRWDSVRHILRKQPFLSLLANELLLYSANPEKGQPLRRVYVESLRMPYQAFFSAVWRNLYDGILQTVVSDPELLQYARDKSATRKQRKEDRLRRKGARQERRQSRQERREERK